MHNQLRKECLKKFRLGVFVSEISLALAALTCSISVTTIQIVRKYRTRAFSTKLRNRPYILNNLGRIVQSWVKITMVSAKVEFRYERLKSKFSLIHFVNKVTIESS